MKKVLAILLMTAVTTVLATDYDNPTIKHKFVKANETIALTYKVVDNPKATCDAESRKRGNTGFAYQVQACAFWTQDTCTIIIGTMTNMHTLGHEMMHCIKGDWHPQ